MRSRFPATLLAAGFLVAAAATAAELPDVTPRPGETRAGALHRVRLAKKERLAPPRQDRVEKALVGLEKGEGPTILGWNWHGLYPAISTIASGGRLAGGARLWRPDLGESPVDLLATALCSLERYQFYDLQLGLIPHADRKRPAYALKSDDLHELSRLARPSRTRLTAYGTIRHRYFPEEDYYGLGSDAPESSQTNYLLEQADLDAVAGWQFTPRFGFNFRAGRLRPDLRSGRDEDSPSTEATFTDATAPGLDRQPDFLRLTAQVGLDLRDEPFNPHRGVFLGLAWSRFDERGGGEFDFDRFAIDARAYLPLYSDQRVLALRAFLSADDPDAGARVPFYLMETLGGSYSLRGYHGLRFRDERVLDLQVEYRWEANDKVEAAIFADFAKAVAHAAAFADVGFRGSYGFGFRFKAPAAVLLRLDLAFSDELTRFYLRLGPSF